MIQQHNNAYNFIFYKSFLSMIFLVCIVTGIKINGHGFAQHTLIKTSQDGLRPLEQVCRLACKKKDQHIESYDPNTTCFVQQHVRLAGESKTNCYCILGFDNNCCNDIVCTPTQEFYIPETKEWIAAYALRVGDSLLGHSNTLVQITRIEFVKKPD